MATVNGNVSLGIAVSTFTLGLLLLDLYGLVGEPGNFKIYRQVVSAVIVEVCL
jgi:hypothetical protein